MFVDDGISQTSCTIMAHSQGIAGEGQGLERVTIPLPVDGADD